MEIKRFNNEPAEESISSNADGSRFIAINKLEDVLDEMEWSTKNFHHIVFKNGYADLVVSASLELVVKYLAGDGRIVERGFVGACSFSIKSLEPNQHFLATAKSECIKNAASDIGKALGRGLNDNMPIQEVETQKRPKAKPDSKIMKQFLEAVEKKDQATIIMLSNVYDIKTEPDAEKK